MHQSSMVPGIKLKKIGLPYKTLFFLNGGVLACLKFLFHMSDLRLRNLAKRKVAGRFDRNTTVKKNSPGN